jgi:hypothetical protein
MDAGDSAATLDRFLALATVDGAALRTAWRTLEPTRRGYDWSSLDAAFEVAAQRGKPLGLHVLASTFAQPPAWLSAQGMQAYSFQGPNGASVTDPVPWDPVYLSEWRTFLTALSAHLKPQVEAGRLAYVSVGVPVPEMSLPGCASARLGSAGPAYDRAAYLDAWKQAASATQESFPSVTKLLPVPVGTICRPDADGPALFMEVLDAGLRLPGARFSAFATDLQGTGSARLDGVPSATSRTTIAFQFIGAATGSTPQPLRGTVLQSACAARDRYRATLVETYKSDLVSTDGAVQEGISALRTGRGC